MGHSRALIHPCRQLIACFNSAISVLCFFFLWSHISLTPVPGWLENKAATRAS